jgi:predicted enzyme related to lactoylglutathione lyase
VEQAVNGIGWFEVGTADPAGAEHFYGGLFGWTFGTGRYREISTGEGCGPSGGIFDHGGQMPNYAVFYVQVDDVAAKLAEAERLGGKTLAPPTDNGEGLVFAHLADADGNHFGIFSPPAG